MIEETGISYRPLTGAELAIGGVKAPFVCYHCKDHCADDHIRSTDKVFCCEGCLMVYDILNTNDLCQYYALDSNAGNSLRQLREARSYTWLDDPATQAQLIHFSDGKVSKVTFRLPGVHCTSCVWLLEHLYRLDKGVLHSTIQFQEKKIHIDFDPSLTSLRKIAALLASIGYAPDLNMGDLGAGHTKAVDRSLYYKIGVAGFAAGNIMLLSFPEYLGLDRLVEAAWFRLFGHLNLLLSLPVLLYSASDYFRSAWQGLRQRYLNIDIPLVAAFIMVYGRSVWEILSGTGAGYLDSFTGLIFFLLIGKWFQQKTYYHLSFERDYRSYFPISATIRQGTQESVVPVAQLEPGDTIVVRHGELIPADGVLLKGTAQIDYAFVTGENELVAVPIGSQVYAGGKQTGERLQITLTRKMNQSYLTQLWNDEAFKPNFRGKTSKLADQAARFFTWLVLVIAIGCLSYWWGFRGDVATALNSTTALLIVACPCVIALAIPFTLGNIMRRLGRQQLYLKNIQVIEAMSSVDTIVLDKTGTLTSSSKTGAQFIPFGGQPPLSEREVAFAKSLAAQSIHPLSQQIAAMYSTAPLLDVVRMKEHAGKGIEGWIGAVHLRLGSANYMGLEIGDADTKDVLLEINGTIRGHFHIQKAYREGLREVLDYFQTMSAPKRKKENTAPGIFVLSGDNDQDAAHLSQILPPTAQMHFRQSPQQKLEFVKRLQQQGHKVLMLGDGLNDAGALKQSDVGVVVTENNSNFTPACDAILHADAFSQLPALLRLAQYGPQIVQSAYVLALVYNIIGLSYAVAGQISPLVAAVLMPASSISIVLYGTFMGNWATQKLGLKAPSLHIDSDHKAR